jgi:serine/threonine protein kinase
MPPELNTIAQDRRGKPKVWKPPSPEELGRVLDRYEVEELLGCGGMGAVYKGRQKTLDRLVAIKILPPEVDDLDASYGERFKNEARAMARLSHPNIVSVHDFGETKDGLLFFIMEFVEGLDVSRMMRQQHALGREHIRSIMTDVCAALQYAHEKGIVHRDIKPANIIVGYDGRVKVADFGLAKITQGSDVHLTESNALIGTLHYMAPEALSLGASVDRRADIYAVGVMLYQMLTGNLPQGLFQMPSIKVPGLDPRYDQVVTRALREKPADRYQTIADMFRDLEEIFAPQTSTSRTRRGSGLGLYKFVTGEDGRPVLLGSGSAGKTYKAVHSLLDTTVALKVIHEALTYDTEVRQRFLNEARAIAKLRHPHIAELRDCGEDEGALFCAMEYCDGGDLEKLVQTRGALPEEAALMFCRQAARALAYVHDQGFLHRDLKPSNLMLSMVPGKDEANIKLIDFGLVKALGQTTGLTRRGQFRGTLLYTSPEQLRGEVPDERTDVFSLGMTLWFMLEGRLPIDTSSSEITRSRLSGINHATHLPESMSPAVRHLLTHMLHPDLRQRARDMHAVLSGIEDCLARLASGESKPPAKNPAKAQETPGKAAEKNLKSSVRPGKTTQITKQAASVVLPAPPPAPASAPTPASPAPSPVPAPPAPAPPTLPALPPATAPQAAPNLPSSDADPMATIRHRAPEEKPTPPSPSPAVGPAAAAPAPPRAAFPGLQKIATATRTKFDLLEEIEGVHEEVGAAWRARRRRTGELLRLTLLHADLGQDTTFVSELEALQKKAAQCRGGFVIPPLALIRFQDHVVFAEELIEGMPLLTVLRARQRLNLMDAAPVLMQVGEACDIAARAGIPGLILAPHAIMLQFPQLYGGRLHERDSRKLLALPFRQWPSHMIRLTVDYSPALQTAGKSAPAASNGTQGDMPCRFARLIYHLLSGQPPSTAAQMARAGYVPVAGLGEESNRVLARIISRELPAEACAPLLRSLLQMENLPVNVLPAGH